MNFNKEMVTEVIKNTKIVDAVHYFKTIDSTQNYAQKNLNKHDGSFIVYAEHQSQGRGRFKREWISPGARGIYMSVVWRPNIDISEMTKFNYHISLAIARSIQTTFNLDVKIKWPNDIYIEHKKVCGFLSEIVTDNGKIAAVICGIGINLRHSEAIQALGTATSISESSKNETQDYEIFFQQLIAELKRAYEDFISDKFINIKSEWLDYTNVFDHELTINEYNNSYKAKALAIDENGFLKVVDQEGNIKKVISADIELDSGD